MKKIFTLLLISSFLIACVGEEGPPGPQGPQGPYIIGNVFEIENVDFNTGNNFSFFGYFNEFIPQVEIFNSDVVLVYLWEGVDNGNDIWSLMPQTFYMTDGGILEYNFNHTVQDFEIYLNGNGNFAGLDPVYTQDQIFRIAVLPADFAQDNNIDITNIYDVMSALEITSETQIESIEIAE